MVLLDAARFSQGVAGALIWSGALTWLITMTPPERRGSVIGTALGTAVAGALIGPALGALAAEIGTEAVFSAVLAISAVFGVLAWRTPESAPPERQSIGRGRGGDLHPARARGHRLRRGSVADVRRRSRCSCRCGSTTSAGAMR